MINFVRFDEHGGVWANKDRALEYLATGFQVFADETCQVELSQEDLEAMDETVRSPDSSTSTQRSSTTAAE